MKKTNVIVTFANLKGGVGKTTLCTLFALYVRSLGIPIKVVDCDGQHSIAQTREKELQQLKNLSSGTDDATATDVPFEVESHSLESQQETNSLIKRLKSFEGVVVLDSPGNLKEEGIVSLLANSDYIACPYMLDRVTIDATATFIMVVYRLMDTLGNAMSARMLFIPNRVDSRFGTAKEKALFSATKLHLSQYGDVTPDVDYRACVQRISSLSLTPDQLKTIAEPFGFMVSRMGLTQDNTELKARNDGESE